MFRPPPPVVAEMSLPSREECEAWTPVQVAFFMHQMQMPECAATVGRYRIDGRRLLRLFDGDLRKFSLIHQPQLQKIVQDIRKSDDSLLNKLRRLRGQAVPSVPARDYPGDDEAEEWSEAEYEEQDDSYEPPPSHRVFSPPSSAAFPGGEYVDSCRNRPDHQPRKPQRTAKAAKPLPAEPSQVSSDDEDYIIPEDGNNGNYIEPTENPSPYLYEAPGEENSLQASRFSSTVESQPPRVSPRVNIRKYPIAQEPTGEDEYELCDSDEQSEQGSPPEAPKPSSREEQSRPVLRTKPLVKHIGFESKTLPTPHRAQAPPPKAFTADFKRLKIPMPQLFTSYRTEDRSVMAGNGFIDTEKAADVYKQPWYASKCDRKKAEDALIQSNKDGSFLVRQSSGQDTQQPYTLVVFYRDKVYNIPVRFIQTTQQYALGREKKGEEHFSSVSRMIEKHQWNPLVLIDSQGNTRDTTKLCHAVKL